MGLLQRKTPYSLYGPPVSVGGVSVGGVSGGGGVGRGIVIITIYFHFKYSNTPLMPLFPLIPLLSLLPLIPCLLPVYHLGIDFPFPN